MTTDQQIIGLTIITALTHTFRDAITAPTAIREPRRPKATRGSTTSGGDCMAWNRDAQVTAVEAATWLPVTSARIRRWAADGRITAVGQRGAAKLYRWGDLIDVERDTRRSPRSSRNPVRRCEPRLAAA